MGCYGNRYVRTPHFDRFAGQGMVLENAISPTPVCVPMRVANMTGLLGNRTGIVTNHVYPDHTKYKTIAHVFKENSYVCGYIGKWHMGEINTAPGDPRRFGFDDFWRVKKRGSGHFKWQMIRNKDDIIEEEGFSPRAMVRHARTFLQRNRNKPFCLYLSWKPPHPPYISHPDNDHYQGVELPPNVFSGKSSEFASHYLPQYYGLIEGIDDAFGVLMKELDRLGLTEKTIVVYTSDHGDMMGSHGLKFKRWPYDESIRIPFLIRWPGKIQAGRRLDMPFSVIDFFPTLAGLSNISYPDNLSGKDFSDVFLGKSNAFQQDAVYLSMHYSYVPWPGWRGVVSERKSIYMPVLNKVLGFFLTFRKIHCK
jgi:arylsulfatase A-like enzyme